MSQPERVADFLLKKRVNLLLLFSLLAILISIQQFYLGPKSFWNGTYTHYNNYVIFKSSFHHLISGENLYTNYPSEYGDLFKYSPSFAWLMGVFSALPDLIGLTFWNLLNILVFVYAIATLKLEERRRNIYLLLYVIFELILSTQNAQSNALMAGLLIMSFSDLEKGRNGRAMLWISLGFFIKLYAIAGLLFLLLYPQKAKSATAFVVYTALLLMLPLISISPEQLLWQYQNWFSLVRADGDASVGMSFYVYMNLIAVSSFAKWPLLFSGTLLLLLSFLVYSRSNTLKERLYLLALVLIWIVVFNPKAESPTFIIAITGIGIWILSGSIEKAKYLTGILTLFFTSLWFTDVIPSVIKKNFLGQEYIKPFGPCVGFIVLAIQLINDQFRRGNFKA